MFDPSVEGLNCKNNYMMRPEHKYDFERRFSFHGFDYSPFLPFLVKSRKLKYEKPSERLLIVDRSIQNSATVDSLPKEVTLYFQNYRKYGYSQKKNIFGNLENQNI